MVVAHRVPYTARDGTGAGNVEPSRHLPWITRYKMLVKEKKKVISDPFLLFPPQFFLTFLVEQLHRLDVQQVIGSSLFFPNVIENLSLLHGEFLFLVG